MNKRQIKKHNEQMKLKAELTKVRNEASEAMQFLVDIGSKKHRAKYKGSNKDLMNNKAEVMNYFLKEITAVFLLRHMCKGKARCNPLMKRTIFYEADRLLEELIK